MHPGHNNKLLGWGYGHKEIIQRGIKLGFLQINWILVIETEQYCSSWCVTKGLQCTQSDRGGGNVLGAAILNLSQRSIEVSVPFNKFTIRIGLVTCRIFTIVPLNFVQPLFNHSSDCF